MLELKDLTIETTSGKPLVSGLDLVLNEEDRVAVIGEEGRGKSTLLKAIHDSKEVENYCYISGNISKNDLVIGYLEQSLNPAWDDEYVYKFFLKDSPEEKVEYEEYEKLKDASRELSRLGVSPEILQTDRVVGSLSGGEKVKIQIAKLLMQNPDVLLLDEPTNDLDIETLEWLEKFIVNSNRPILFISHDETLLEGTANVILHLEYVKTKKKARHTLQKGDYQTYVQEREREIENREREFKREHREFKKDKQILSREKSKVRTAQINIKDSAVRRILNKQMKNILTRERMAEEKLETEKLETEDPIYFTFDEEVEIPNGKRILDLSLDELKVGDKVLARDIELNVVGPTKVAIIGENGIGKTTLLREIHKILESRDDINVGYMPQDYTEILNDDDIVLEYLVSDLEEIDLDQVTAYMGRIKLSWDEMNGQMGDLSYGQKAKVMILKMMLDKRDVLLLDEPTRNLSALSSPVMREILKGFKGSIISVSHDRKFLKEVCDKVYRLEKDGLSRVSIK